MVKLSPATQPDQVQPLANVLAERPCWPYEEALALIRDVAEQVAALHRNGQVHLSIGPATISVSPTGKLQLATPPAVRAFGGMASDPEYCPPELADVERFELPSLLAGAQAALVSRNFSLDPRRIDAYQIGVLGCRLVTGKPVQSYLYSPSTKAGVPLPMLRLLDRSLGFDDLNRFNGCESLTAAIDSCLAEFGAGESIALRTRETESIGREGTSGGSAGLVSKVTPLADELPLIRLGNFRIVAKLGQGGMGDVYKAYDETLHRSVAIKVLPPELARDGDFVNRFRSEAIAVAKLAHPNIVQVYSIGEEQGRHYFAMQFVEGESLAEHLHRVGRIEASRALVIVEQCLAGLAAAHDEGLIHRDIKPANILLEAKSGRALVADFGLVKRGGGHGRMTATGVILGTVDYISPEQARGKPVDARSDLYSLGVMLYELLSGRLPFEAESVTGMIFQHCYESPRPLLEAVTGLPADLEKVVHRLLQKQSDERYQSARQVLADLQAVREGRQIAETEPVLAMLAPDVESQPSMPSKLQEPIARAPQHRWRDRAMSIFGRRAPRWIKELQGTTQQVDGAIAEYRRRREKLAVLADEGRALAAELAGQVRACQEAAHDAERRAKSAAEESEARQAEKEYEACQEQLVDLAPQLERQESDVAEAETKLAQADAMLAKLQSQRELLQARLKAANVGLRMDSANSTKSYAPSNKALFAIGAAVICSLMALATVYLAERLRYAPTVVTPSYYHPPPIGTPPVRPPRPSLVHDGIVWSAAFAPSGPIFASGGRDGCVLLWNLTDGAAKQAFRCGASVRVVAFSPDASFLAAGAEDGWVRFWTLDGRVRTAPPRIQQNGSVRCLAFGPGEGRITVGDTQGLTIIWDLSSRAPVRRLAGHTYVVSSVAVSADQTTIATSSWDGTVRLWDPASGTEIGKLAGHTGGVDMVRFSPNDRMLATGSGDHTVRLWQRDSRKELALIEHPGGVASVAFDADGVYLATACNDGVLRLFDVESRRELGHADTGQGPLMAIDFSADKKWLVSVGRTGGAVRLWQVAKLLMSRD